MPYGSVRRMKQYSKICDNFRAINNSAEFGGALWAIPQDLVKGGQA